MQQNIDHLSELGQALYNQYVPAIFKAPGQVRMFIVLLETLDFREKIKAEIENTGLLITTPSGIKRSNPLLADLQKCEGAFTRLCSQLGLAENFKVVFEPHPMDAIFNRIGYPGF